MTWCESTSPGAILTLSLTGGQLHGGEAGAHCQVHPGETQGAGVVTWWTRG